jgi:Tol biopolymer transport system component
MLNLTLRRQHAILAPFVAVIVCGNGLAWAGGITERVGVGMGSVQANSYTEGDSISGDGRYVPFGSDASNLVAGDNNGLSDVFLRDRLIGTTTMMSRGINGGGGDNISYGGHISADGRFVSFVSLASDLVLGGTNGQQQAYVYDRQTGETAIVSVAKKGGVQADKGVVVLRISAEVQTGKHIIVGAPKKGGAQADQGVFTPNISADGSYISYASFSTNLVPSDTNNTLDVFVYAQKAGVTSRVSVGVNGEQICDFGASGGALSADGRFVAINTGCTNMVPGRINEQIQSLEAYVYDRKTGRNELISVGPDGKPANDFSLAIAISADGRYVGLLSYATNLVSGGTNGQSQIYVRDRKLGTTELVSVGPGGVQGNGFSSGGEMSPDGRFVVFSSEATNLVSNDTNGQSDIFVRDRLTGETQRVSIGPSGLEADGRSLFQGLTANGLTAVFSSEATNLVPGDTNGQLDVFIHTQ